MYENNGIIITKVGNGYIVRTPMLIDRTAPDYLPRLNGGPIIGGLSQAERESIREMAKEIRKVDSEDELLSSLQKQSEPENVPKLSLPVQENLFVFKHHRDVITFLMDYFTENDN